MARLGKARLGPALQGKDHGSARFGWSGFGSARYGKARNAARYGPAWLGTRIEKISKRFEKMDKVYEVTLEGRSGFLMHADNIDWRDFMDKWTKDPENARNTKPGDDRTPAWRWLGAVYHDERYVGLPSDNIMTCLREGGAKIPVAGKGKETFKKRTQSGVMVNEIQWPIEVNGTTIPWPEVNKLLEEEDFSVHQETVKGLGFNLFVKGARIGRSKHIRVRPRFDTWKATGTIVVFDESITQDVLARVFDVAGKYCGIGDWRPSAQTSPGPWGKFEAKIREV